MDAVTIFSLLKQIPNVVWAAIIAPLLTLSGVVLANHNSRKQQQAALKHDADQRDREREMSLRREVYLPAAEAVSRGQNLLVRLPDLNISDQELTAEFRQDSAAIAKIQVVGTNTTVQAVSVFLHELISAYLELSLLRFQIMGRKNQIESLAQFIDKSSKEIDRHIALMKQLNLEGNTDERVWKVVDDNIQFENKQIEQFNNEKQQLSSEQKKEHLQFVQLCIERFISVSQFIPPAVFAVREELELTLDKEAYLNMFNENLKKGKAVLDSFVVNFEKLIDT